MEELWKPIKTIKSDSSYHIKGDTYYISNLGRVKLNDTLLSIGKGLYVDKEPGRRGSSYNLKIVGFSKYIYHYVFELFFNEPKKKHYQLHHIDYDRMNNRVDNLIYVSPYEHGKIHSNDHNDITLTQRIHTLHSQYQSLYEQKENHIRDYKKYLSDRKINLLISRKEELKNKRLVEIQQRQAERQKEIKKVKEDRIQSLLATGNYILRSNGWLYPKTNPKSSESLKQFYANHPEQRLHISKMCKKSWTKEKRELFSQKVKSEWTKERREKLSQTKKSKYNK